MGNLKTENTISELKRKKESTKDENLKNAIQNKIDYLKSNKDVLK